jgi:hypothetical protein
VRQDGSFVLSFRGGYQAIIGQTMSQRETAAPAREAFVRRKELLTASSGIASALAFGTAARAAAAPDSEQNAADAFEVQGRITGMIAQLQNLQPALNGDRVAALAALKSAQDELVGIVDIRGPDVQQSDALTRIVIGELDALVARLNTDLADNPRIELKAISYLQSAQGSLRASLSKP